jgi:photosystem II stability/assembly factor-like uncharacterized protein
MHWKTWLICICFFLAIIGEGRKDIYGEVNRWSILKKNVFKRSLAVLVVDPSNTSILYASVGDTGILKSYDGGKNWWLKNNGLLNQTIKKIVIDPLRSNNVYACTAGGLYRSVDGGGWWEAIGFAPDTAVNAVAMVPETPDTLYAAVGTFLYRTQNGGKSWRLVPDTIRAMTRAIVVSPVNPNELYVATGEGIHQIRNHQDTLEVIHGPDEWEDEKIDLVVDPFHTKVIFALSDTGGIFWAQQSEWRWRKMNEGLKKSDFPILSMGINPVKPRTLCVTTGKGNILTYDFAIPEIGVLDFSAVGIPSWEISRFSRRLADNLNQTHFVKWLGKDELSAIDSSLAFLDNSQTVRQIGLLFGFETVVSGTVLIDPEEIEFIPSVTFVERDTILALKKSIKKPRYDYFPAAANEVADWVYKTINGRNTWWERNFWRGSRKSLVIGSLAGFTVGFGLGSLLNYGTVEGDDSWLERNFWRGSRKFVFLGTLTGFAAGYALNSTSRDKF